MSCESVVIVGASLAGTRSAKELRTLGFDGRITLIGDESGLPYDRPPLSKQYLVDESPDDSLLLTSSDEMDELDLELLSGTRVTAVDLPRSRVHCEGLGDIGFTHLVAATGAHPRRPAWARDLRGINHLRTLADAQRLKEALTPAEHVTIVGGGFIGTEVAATMRSQGKRVTLVVDTPYVLENLGMAVGARFTELFRDRGVEVLNHSAVVDAIGTARVEALRLSDGRLLETDTVVVAVGALPAIDWLGDLIHRGRRHVVIDEHSRADANFWAAGDVTGTGHWYAAVRQARLAARSILDLSDRTRVRLLEEVPYAWTDQFELKVQTLGSIGAGQDWCPVPGHDLAQVEEAGATGLYSRQGVVTGGVMVDRPQDMAKLRRHISMGSPIESVRDHLGALVGS